MGSGSWRRNMAAVIEVVTPGLLATVQDLGRPAASRHAVPACGAMDAFALQAANRLLGNEPGDAAIEITAGGAAFRMLSAATLALAGADLRPTLNQRPAPMWSVFAARPGDMLALLGPRAGWGARVYLAVGGGVDVPAALGSHSTDLSGRFGGFLGRALQTGDVLTAAMPLSPDLLVGRRWREELRPRYGAEPVVRVVPGPHLDCFDPTAVSRLFGQPYRVGAQSNRMGYRLEGPSLTYVRPCSLPSFGVLAGALQVPPDGQPILLMADAQTTGGYPIAGVVIQADVPLCAQLLPGDPLRFTAVSLEEAVAALREVRGWIEGGLVRPDDDGSGEALLWAGALS